MRATIASVASSLESSQGLAILRGRVWLVCVLMALTLAAMAWSVWWLGRGLEASMQTQLMARQAQEATLWARLLAARLEAQQRLLGAVAQGMHTSLLDKPEVLDALVRQEGSVLGLFEALHVALPSGAVSHHSAVVADPRIDSQGMQALQRTLTEGKPSVMGLQPMGGDSEFLRVLLAVPIRRAEGAISGALAATVRFPVGGLMPDAGTLGPGAHYMLLDENHVALMHSDRSLRGQAQQTPWEMPPAGPHVYSQRTGQQMVTRVGLALPQWQAVVVRESQGGQAWLPGLGAQSWAVLPTGAAILVMLGAALLWRAVPVRMQATRAAAVQPERQMNEEVVEPGNTKEQAVLAQLRTVLESVPTALLTEVGGGHVLMTPQAGVLLGYCRQEAEPVALHSLFAQMANYREAQQALQEMGCLEALLPMRKKDGGEVLVYVAAWLAGATLGGGGSATWQLSLPWRSRPDARRPEVLQPDRDGLTGLPGREAFLWQLQSWVTASMQPVPGLQPAAVKAQARVPQQGCLLFADVDHLGMMNEATSREMGNKVLVHVGHLMASYVQPLGDLARLGGDEFAVLLPGISLAHAQGIGQALCDAVWHWQPHWQGERQWVSISVGIVAVDALRHEPEDALRAADMTCYEAKRRGRCQVVVGHIAPRAPAHVAR